MKVTFSAHSMYFETHSTDTKKIFTVKFPYDVIFSLRWDEDEQRLLQDYEKSQKVSDKLTMLAMIAKKIEDRGELTKVKEVKDDEQE